jgi:hypothetical protein
LSKPSRATSGLPRPTDLPIGPDSLQWVGLTEVNRFKQTADLYRHANNKTNRKRHMTLIQAQIFASTIVQRWLEYKIQTVRSTSSPSQNVRESASDQVVPCSNDSSLP